MTSSLVILLPFCPKGSDWTLLVILNDPTLPSAGQKTTKLLKFFLLELTPVIFRKNMDFFIKIFASLARHFDSNFISDYKVDHTALSILEMPPCQNKN